MRRGKSKPQRKQSEKATENTQPAEGKAFMALQSKMCEIDSHDLHKRIKGGIQEIHCHDQSNQIKCHEGRGCQLIQMTLSVSI